MTHGRIGLLGGTFDPPHIGHLIAAEEARVSLGLDQVRLLVAGDPWMKATTSPPAHRVAMAEIAVADHPALLVDDREIHRQGPTYTADTLKELRDHNPRHEFVFLLGADAAAKLPDWKRAEEALARARFVALTRPGYDLDREDPLLWAVETLKVPSIQISSTDLRRRFANGDAVRYQLPRPVEEYARAFGLYGTGDA